MRDEDKLPPNELLRKARRSLRSPSGSGREMSRQELADAINAYLAGRDEAEAVQEASLDANTIGKLERGEHRWPSSWRRRGFRHVLNVATDRDIGFYIIRRPTSTTASITSPSASDLQKATGNQEPSSGFMGRHKSNAGAPFPWTDDAGDDLDVGRARVLAEWPQVQEPRSDSVTVLVMIDGGIRRLHLSRRALLEAAAGASVAALIDQLPGVPHVIDPTVVDHFATLRALLVDADNRLGGAAMLPTVLQQLALIGEFRRRARGPLRERLLSTEARWAEFAGWLSDDLGLTRAGSSWLAQAADLAQEADDPEFSSYVFARKAQRAATDGDQDRVLGLAGAALRSGPARPLVRAFAILQQARGHAVLGDQIAFESCIEQARGLTTVAPPVSGDLGSFCTAPYVALQEGEGWLCLNRPKAAVERFETAAAAWPAPYFRERGLCLARTADAHLRAGNADQAAAVGLQARELGQLTGSQRVAEEVETLTHKIGRRRGMHTDVGRR